MPTPAPTSTPSTSGAFNGGAALSPTQIQQFRAQYNIQPQAPKAAATTGGSGGSSDPWAGYDAAVKPSTQASAQPSEDLGGDTADAYSDSADQVTRGVKTGADAISNNDGSFGGTAKAVGGVLEGGVDAAAGLVKGGVAPLTGLMKFISSLAPASTDKSDLQKIGEPLFKDLYANHPEASKNIDNILTLLTAAMGGEAAPETSVAEGTGAVKNVISDIKGAPAAVKDSLASRQAASAAAKEEAAKANSIKAAMPLADKAQRMGDLLNTKLDSSSGKGGVAREGMFGKSVPQATATDIERGLAAHPYITGKADPVEQLGNLNKGIEDLSNERDTFSDTHKTPSNFADMRDYMEANNTPSSNLKNDPGAEDAYNRVTQKALDTVYQTMKGSAEKSGDYGAMSSGKDIRQARIAIDQQIKAELNENTFGTPQYKGIKAAAIDTRNLLNRMEEDLQRYPGQLEQLNKYNADLATLREKGISTNAKGEVTPEAQQALKDKYGLKSTPESEANANKLAEYNKQMSHLYDAQFNVAEKYQANVGKYRPQEVVEQNPLLNAGYQGAKGVAKSFGLGAGVHLLP